MKLWITGREHYRRKIISCSSCNDVALLESKTFPHRTGWVYAIKQKQGRGRYGRKWVSLHGNVMTSFFCTMPVKSSQNASIFIMLLASLAVFDVIKALLPEGGQQRLLFKWPNDILLDKRKISGTLIESHATVFPKGEDAHVIAGIGINVRRFPKELLKKTTSLRHGGIIHAQRSVIQRALEERFLLLSKICRKHHGFFTLLRRVKRHLFPNEEKFFTCYQNIHQTPHH